MAIFELKTLRQIHLSTGNQMEWNHDWVIDHKCLRRHFSNLPLLEKLAFSRDTYLHDQDDDGKDYYEDGDALAEMGSAFSPDWERKHLSRILNEAQRYPDSMRNLTWMFFGQIPMGVTTSTVRRKKKRRRGARKRGYDTSYKRDVSALSEKRNCCETALRRIFGGITG